MAKVTQAEIGRRLGLAQITVSKALRGDADISEKTRQRVLAMAEELGYVANPFARTLAEGGSPIIGVYLHTFRGKYHSTLVESLERSIRRRGYIPLLTAPGDAGSDNADAIGLLLKYRARGVLMTVRNALWHQASIAQIRKAHVPLVLMGRFVETDVCSIYADDYNGLKLAVDHLRRFGHRHIGLAGLAYDIPNLVAHSKEQGFIDALAGKHVPDLHDSPLASRILRFRDGRELDQLRQYLLTHPDITAFACFGDSIALELIRCLKQLGHEVPRDYSVVGHGDDIEYVDYMTPPLTTMSHNVEQSGELAVDLLFQQINGPGVPPHQIMKNHLVERLSVAPPR
ncbi:MAG: LacI family DNA-binding transcriptional regulator [Phycisphaeraceae bacterium]|nr:LacI family DNA-binding transcriptional regulator [Phycisphaeraceae bacterium]